MQKEFALFGLNELITNISNILIVFQIFTGKKKLWWRNNFYIVLDWFAQCKFALSVYSRYVTQ